MIQTDFNVDQMPTHHWKTEALFVPTVRDWLHRGWNKCVNYLSCCPSLQSFVVLLPWSIREYTVPPTAFIYGVRYSTNEPPHLAVWLIVYAVISTLPNPLFMFSFWMCVSCCTCFVDMMCWLTRLANLFRIAWWVVGVVWWSLASLTCSPPQVVGIVALIIEGLAILRMFELAKPEPPKPEAKQAAVEA